MGNGKTRKPERDVRKTSRAVYGQGRSSGGVKPQGFNALATWSSSWRKKEREGENREKENNRVLLDKQLVMRSGGPLNLTSYSGPSASLPLVSLLTP